MDHPPQPTPEQCERKERLPDFQERPEYPGRPAFATWYPQMGGYCSICVVVQEEGCFGVYVWHDGDFPFHGNENPAYLHHCSAEQFIKFGSEVRKFQKSLGK